MKTQNFIVAGLALALLSVLNLQLSPCYAAPGDLDTTFAGTGKLRLGFGGGPASGDAAVVQGDGKLILAGDSQRGTTNDEFALVRLDTNDVPDTSFGVGGKVLTSVGPVNNAAIHAVGIQADGKIVAAGYADNGTNNFANFPDFALVRYNPDGSLDASFGNGGKVITTFDPLADETINAIVIQPDGKILVAGSYDHHVLTEATGFALARYETNGTLDASFGSGGVVQTDFLGNGGTAFGLMLQPDGKIVAVGTSTEDFALARYTTNGVLDTTFGSGGLVFTSVGYYDSFFGGYAAAHAVATQFGNNTVLNPNKIVAAGEAEIGLGVYGFAVVRYNLDGSLDTSFGNGGIVTNVFDPGDAFGNSYGEALIVQGFLSQPRKITVGGFGIRSAGNTNYFAMVRLNASGAFDTSFGTKGTGEVRLSFGPDRDDEAYAMTLQSGRIVLAGLSVLANFESVFAAARFNSDGSPDTTFGNGGIVTADTDFDSCARGVATQSDGKLVVVGGADVGPGTNFALARYNTDGSLDGTFGTNGGRVTLTIASSNAVADAVRLQSDGKIVVAGYGYNDGTNNFAVIRCGTNGALDDSFGGTGEVTTSVGTSNAAANALVLQSDGKIIAAGYGFNGPNQDFAVVRYNPNGTLDTSFGGTGKVATGIGSGGAQAFAVQVQSDGKIVAAGEAQVGSDVDNALVRYSTNGALDNSFGTLGRVTTDFGGGTDGYGLAMAIQPDGKIVVAGRVVIGGTGYIVLTRYNTNGAPDSTFGFSGQTITQIGSISDYATALALQSDGKILLAGASQSGDYQFFVQRYNSNGSVDTSYGNNGAKLLNFETGADEFAYALALDSSGRAVIAGDAGSLFGVARLLGDALPGIALSISLPSFNTAKVSWPYPSTGWSLQENSDLNSTNWVTPSETINDDGTNNFIIVTPPAGNRFYRLTAP